MIERVGQRRRIAQQQRTLAAVIEEQRWQDEAEPGEPDRLAAEMAHVGVQRFGAGDGENDRAERDERLPMMMPEKGDGMGRVQGTQNRRIGHDLEKAKAGQDGEPQAHDRAEQHAHAAGAALLQQEEPGQDRDRGRHDIGLEPRRRDIQAFDRAQHRDRRRQDAISIEKRCADHGQQDRRALSAGAGAHTTLDQARQGQDATLPLVVGAHDHGDIFDRDDQEQRPEDQREHPENCRLAERQAAACAERLPQGVERAGADIAEHDAHGADRQAGKPTAAGAVRHTGGGGGVRAAVPEAASRDGMHGSVLRRRAARDSRALPARQATGPVGHCWSGRT